MTRLPLRAFLALLALLALVSLRPAVAQSAASPLTQLSLHSQPGDYVGAGKDYLFNANDGKFTASVSASGGQATYITINLSQGGGGEYWTLNFASPAGTGLTSGTYAAALRSSDATHAGLDVYGDSRGNNQVSGTFTVSEVTLDTSGAQPRLVSFAASFEEHGEGRTAALIGSIYYNSYTHPAVADTSHPTTTYTASGPIGQYGRFSGPVQVALAATDPDGAADVATTFYQLDGGAAQAYAAPFTVTGDALHSLNYWSVDRAGNTEPRQLKRVWIDTSAPASVPALSQLAMTSDPGDYIGQGNIYLYNSGDGTFTANASASVAGGKVDSLNVSFQGTGASNSHFWFLNFNTTQIGTALVPGEYDDAQRAAFTSLGHPGLDVSGDGRGSNQLAGKFTVLDAVFDYSVSPPKVVSFAATFEQHSEGGVPALHGAIYYHSAAYPTNFPLASISFSPARVPGGTAATGVVTLTDAAGAGGQTVTLTSSSPSLASVPASVTVAAGTAAASFPVTTGTVGASAAVTITAAGVGPAQSAILTLMPPSVASLTVSPTSLTGGQTATATVSLNGPAPTGGITVMLGSSDTAHAAVPTSVAVPAGASRAAFSVATTPVTTALAVTLSATANGGNVTSTLTLTPRPAEPTHVLWTYTDGTVSLWGVNAAGEYSYHNYGPYPGWAATALATDSRGHSYLLWNHTVDGAMSLWNINSDGVFTQNTYGPFAGWTATALAIGPDNMPRVSWTHTPDGQLSLWRITPDGSYVNHEYGAYPGWGARSLSVGPDAEAHLLWTYAGTGDFGDAAPSGKIALWDVGAAGGFSYSLYGPFAGWSAGGLATGPDGSSHIAWTRADGAFSLWGVAPDGTYTYRNYGPYGGWTETALAVGHDNIPRVLWNNASGQISLWSVNANNPFSSFSYVNYGPFSGWTATALSVQP